MAYTSDTRSKLETIEVILRHYAPNWTHEDVNEIAREIMVSLHIMDIQIIDREMGELNQGRFMPNGPTKKRKRKDKEES
jgi:hypothetical protein